jgi:endogenous inhibitor of DNA gyrase (YacG/DUF329 family)
MNCPHCDRRIDDVLVKQAAMSLIAKATRERGKVECPKCGMKISPRQLRRRPRCPHMGKEML